MKRIHLFFVLMCLFSFSKAQDYKQFTPYEELRTSQKMLKPYYSDDLPYWAKMLYQYPINFYEIEKEFNLWEQQEKQRTGEISRRNNHIATKGQKQGTKGSTRKTDFTKK